MGTPRRGGYSAPGGHDHGAVRRGRSPFTAERMRLQMHMPNDETVGNSGLHISNQEFYRVVFRECADRVVVCSFPGDPLSDKRSKWIAQLSGDVGARLENASLNHYYCTSTFTDNLFTTERGTSYATRRKTSFAALHVFVIDDVALNNLIGDGRKVLASFVFDRLPRPTFMIETSPNNAQVGYVFAEPVTHRVAAECLIDGAIRSGLTADGKDPGMSGVTRYVRPPVGTNGKKKYVTPDHPRGFPTRLIEWNPDRVVTIQEVASAFNIPLATMMAAREKSEQDGSSESFAASEARTRVPWREEWRDIMPPRDSAHAAQFLPGDLTVLRGGMRDPLFLGLEKLGLVMRGGGGMTQVRCPFEHLHSGRDKSGAAFMPMRGTINCFHGHCVGRRRSEYDAEVVRLLKEQRAVGAEKIIADLTPRGVPRTPAVDTTLSDNVGWAIDVAINRFMEDRKTNAYVALLQMAHEVARYVIAGRINHVDALESVEERLEGKDVSIAAWRQAFSVNTEILEKMSDE
jgi:hypothetical protein